jgi:hypothetical protein
LDRGLPELAAQAKRKGVEIPEQSFFAPPVFNYIEAVPKFQFWETSSKKRNSVEPELRTVLDPTANKQKPSLRGRVI